MEASSGHRQQVVVQKLPGFWSRWKGGLKRIHPAMSFFFNTPPQQAE
jgi:hypothetical protein